MSTPESISLESLMVKDKYIIEDQDWAEEIADVEPLKGKPEPHQRLDSYQIDDFQDNENPESDGEVHANLLEQEVQGYALERLEVEPRPKTDVVVERNDSSQFSGYSPSVDGKTRKKLAQGEIPFTGRIDLHGLVEDEAWKSLIDFINSCQDNGEKCVLVIHGKGNGYGPQSDMGIIKSRMCEWLQNHPGVLAFHTAIPRNGGDGAVYVLLKKLAS